MYSAVKMADGADDQIEGLAAPFGGFHNGKDLQGEYFTKSTDFALDWFAEIPLLYAHGRDEAVDIAVVGRVKSRDLTDDGAWAKAQLDKSSKYFEAIKQLIADGKLFFSSGAMAHLVKTNKSTGEVTRWPWVELSLTPTPANLLATVEPANAIKHFEAAGLKTDVLENDETLKAMSASDGASGGYNVQENSVGASGRGDFAYVDANGRGHLPIGDAAHVRAAMSRFNQTQFESPAKKKSAAKKILAKANKLKIDVADDSDVAMAAKSLKDLPDGPTLMSDADDNGPYPEGSYEDLADDIAQALRQQTRNYAYVVATFPDYALVRCCGDDADMDDFSDSMPDLDYYRVAYTLDDMGEPVLGEMQQVEPAMIPSTGKSADLLVLQTDEAPLAIQAARLTTYAALLNERTKDVHERRTKEGRVLSAPNRTRLGDTADALETALKALRDLLDATAPVDEAKAIDEVALHRYDFLAHATRLRRLQLAAMAAD